MGREISSIPTEYAGVKFRSRLEAQTARLFEACGILWEYEKYSFLLPSGINYRPDFFLPVENCWLECRGYYSEDGERQISEFAEFTRKRDQGFIVVPWDGYWLGYLPPPIPGDDNCSCSGSTLFDACQVSLALLIPSQRWSFLFAIDRGDGGFHAATLSHCHVPLCYSLPQTLLILANRLGIPRLPTGEGYGTEAAGFVELGWLEIGRKRAIEVPFEVLKRGA